MFRSRRLPWYFDLEAFILAMALLGGAMWAGESFAGTTPWRAYGWTAWFFPYGTPEAACQAAQSDWHAQQVSLYGNIASNLATFHHATITSSTYPKAATCYWLGGDGSGPNPFGTVGQYAPTNSTATATTFTCNSGYVESGYTCVAASSQWPDGTNCSSYNGTQFEILSPSGWDTNPNPAVGSAIPVERTQPGAINDHGCKANLVGTVLDASGMKKCVTDSTPGATGMYATRCYVKFGYTGAAATSETTTAANFNPTPPECTGQLGTVNGQTVCIPIAGATAAATPVAPKVNTDGTSSARVTPADVYTPGSSDGGRGVSGTPGSPGTLGAPSTADPGGYGRGGSGATTTASSGTGASNVSVSVNTCGAPGQPACKIDESGVDGAAATQSQTDAKTALDSHKAKLDAAAGSGSVSGLGIGGLSDYSAPSQHEQGGVLHSLFPAPATCQPYTFSYRGGLTFDVCPVVNYAKPILEWMMYALTVLYIYFLFWRRRQSQGE